MNPGQPGRRRLLRSALAACAGWTLTSTAQAQARATRVALVIGNAAYAGAALPNAAHDARAMSSLLRRIGFEVVEANDAGMAQMHRAIARTHDLLKGQQGVGMLYYAGHGLQLDWRNYMLPVDAQPTRATEVPEQAVDVQSVLDAFRSAGNRMNILVLDACRENPFPAASSAKGLAPLDAPPGSLRHVRTRRTSSRHWLQKWPPGTASAAAAGPKTSTRSCSSTRAA